MTNKKYYIIYQKKEIKKDLKLPIECICNQKDTFNKKDKKSKCNKNFKKNMCNLKKNNNIVVATNMYTF